MIGEKRERQTERGKREGKHHPPCFCFPLPLYILTPTHLITATLRMLLAAVPRP